MMVNDAAEGKTLEEMMVDKDPWLRKKENIDGLLVGLLDIIGDLHQRNVSPGDVNPANIVVFKDTGKIELSGLDRNYSYGTQIDFDGLGDTVAALRKKLPYYLRRRYRKFERLCRKPDVYEGELYTALLPKNINYAWIFGSIIALTAVAGIVWYVSRIKFEDEEVPTQHTAQTDTLRMKTPLSDSIATSSNGDSIMPSPSALSAGSGKYSQTDKLSHIKPTKETRQIDMENIIQGCYSNLSTIFQSAEFYIENPYPEFEEDIVYYMEQIEEYLVADKEAAIAKLSASYPAMNHAEIESMVESSDPYHKFNLHAKYILDSLRGIYAKLRRRYGLPEENQL